MPSESDRLVGSVLREMRERLGITQSDLANKLKWPQSFVSKVETGLRALKLSEAYGYANALNMNVADFVNEVGEALA